MARNAKLLWHAPILLSLAACSSSEARGREVSLLTCEHVIQEHDLVDTWTVQAAPSVTIGGGSEEANSVLFDVRSVRRLPDGSFVVANTGTGEVRVFGRDGEFVRTIGRRGPGPEEFENLSDVFVLSGDTLVIFDGYPPAYTIATISGDIVKKTRIEAGVNGLLLERAVGIVDRALILLGSTSSARNIARTATGVDRVPLELYASSLDTDSSWHVASLPGMEIGYEKTESGIRRMSLPVWRSTLVAAAAEGLIVTDNDSRVLLRMSLSGDTLSDVHVPMNRRPMTPALLEQYIEDHLAGYPPLSRSQYESWRRVVDDLSTAGDAPYISRIAVDDEQRIWVQAATPPGYDGVVLLGVAPSSQAVCLELPAGIAFGPDRSIGSDVLEIGHDYVLGVWKDSLDVESIYLWAVSSDR